MSEPLSDRGRVLLERVNAASEWEGLSRPGSVLRRYFYPPKDGIWHQESRTCVWVGGAGDAAVFRGLETKGLIEPAFPGTTDSIRRYAYVVTAAGIAALGLPHGDMAIIKALKQAARKKRNANARKRRNWRKNKKLGKKSGMGE